jgi:lipopolysaccharide transport system ATP-binding protein
MDAPLIRTCQVGKKFCRATRRSALYGVQDIITQLVGIKKDISLRAGEFWAVNNISFELERGDCLGIIGPNGAGKSTLLKMINNIILPDRGSIEINGSIGALIEIGAGFHPLLTGRENIYLGGTILGLSKKEIDARYDDIVAFSGCGEFIDTPVKYYSSGMYARLGFAVAIQNKPDILIIDEVLAVGDMNFRAKCFSEIYKLLDKSAVIFISHNLPDVSRICNRLLVMNKGECAYYGDEVSRGISIYQSFQSKPVSSVYTNKASFEEIKLMDEYGHEQSEFNYGSILQLELAIKIDESYPYVDINTLIANQDLLNIMQCSSFFSGYEIVNTGGTIRIRVNLGRIHLNAGYYTLSVGITSKFHGEALARYSNIRRFRVVSHALGYAPIQIPGNWEIVSEHNGN